MEGSIRTGKAAGGAVIAQIVPSAALFEKVVTEGVAVVARFR